MPDSGSDPTTLLFVEYLQRLEAGESVDFEAFCAEHPDHADALRDRRRFNDDLCSMMERVGHETLGKRIKHQYGDEADPNISLKGEAEGSSDLGNELIDRLAGRGEGYGRYKLKGEIDRGGQGAILRVWDEDLRRNLAMKIMLGQVEIEHTGETPAVDSKTLGRFLEEAQVTGQLDHPGIVPVHELGLDAEGRVYFTMKLVKGESLAAIFEKVRSGEDGWNQTRALGVLLKVCEAMAYAHDKGVIHRDLKPANIMVGSFGEVYVMDWGLARIMGREDKKDIRIKPVNTTIEIRSDRRDEGQTPDSPLITMDGDVVGTPAYMSPEQAMGDLDQVGPQSDVYSMGAVLYELLAGHMPYVLPGMLINNYAVWSRVQAGPPEPLHVWTPKAPLELVAICQRAMERRCEDRYVDTQTFADDLRAFLEGHVVRAYRTGPVVEFSKWVRRNRAAAAGLLVFVGAIAAVSWVQYRGRLVAEAERHKARVAERAAEDQATLAAAREEQAIRMQAFAEEQERHAVRQGYVANLRAADLSIQSGDLGEAWRRLTSCAPEHRGWEWDYLTTQADQSLRVLAEPWHTEIAQVGFLEDGARLAILSMNELKLTDIEGGEIDVGAVTSDYGWSSLVAFSPDGRFVLKHFATRSTHLLDAWSGTELWRDDDQRDSPRSAGFSHDGAMLATCRKGIVRVRTTSGKYHQVVDVAGDTHRGLAFHPFLDRLAVVGETLSVFDCETGDVVLSAGVAGDSVAYSPTGEVLAASDIFRGVRIVDALTGEVQLTLELDGVECVALSPLGRIIACGMETGNVRIFDGRTGDSLRKLRGHEDSVRSIAFDPSGRLIATGASDYSTRVWTWRETTIRTLAGRWGVSNVVFVDDGARLLTDTVLDILGTGKYTKEATVLYDLRTGAVHRVRAHEADVTALDAGPDGLAAVGLKNGVIEVMQISTGEVVCRLEGHAGPVSDLAFSHGGHLLASAVSGETARLWSTESWNRVDWVGDGVWPPPSASPSRSRASLCWGPEDALLAVETMTQVERGDTVGLAHRARVWAVEEGRLVREFPSDGPYGMAFSEDGSTVFFGTYGGEIRGWSLDSGEPTVSLRGHTWGVSSIEFMPGGRLLTASDDGTVKIWLTDPYECLLTLRLPDGIRPPFGRRPSARASPDGTKIAIYGHQLQIWDSVIPALTATLSPVEKQQYLESMFERHHYSRHVAEAILQDEHIAPSVRDELAKSARAQAAFLDDPGEMNRVAWRTVRGGTAGEAAYRKALELARAATELDPSIENQNTLCAALFRSGSYSEAVEALTRADKMNVASASPYSRASDLFFSAMAYSRLGDDVKARSAYVEACELMDYGDADHVAFQSEAREILGL